MLNTTIINKDRKEQLTDLINFKFKADNDLILYYHLQTIKNEVIEEIDNTRQSRKII